MILPEALAWIVLVAGGACELLWAQALVPAVPSSARHGSARSRVRRSAQFVLGLAASLGGLALALSAIEVTTAYAVWVGVGALATIVFSVARGHERLTWLRALFITCLLGGAVGLRTVG